MPPLEAVPRICVALGFPNLERLLEHAHREVEAGENFLEFRLDHLDEPARGVAAIREFVKDYPDCTILATCRRHQNHGKFNGSVEEEIRILEGAVAAGARAVDIEIETAEATNVQLDGFRGRALLVISYHNFEGTPAMEPVLRRMMRFPADAYKLVSTARKPSDNFRVLSLARQHARVPLILLAMGEVGFPSRVLSPIFGGLYTYAAPTSAEGTAAGQVCSRQLRQLYRVEKLARSAKIYGVIADPVRHSISPVVHNRAFHARRLDAVYLPLLVQSARLRDFMTLADKLPISGFSVTVNTVWRKAGKWRGTNTHAEGVRIRLEKHLRLSKSAVLVVGNGGAARGAAFALADAGAKVSIVGRNPDRVRALAKACNAEPLMREQLAARHFDGLVHATPLGMVPNTSACFFEDGIPAEVVLDMVYTPFETVLIRRAREQGRVVVHGIEMFLEQAARQFEIWTGENAPLGVMEKAAREALACQAEPIMTK
jgi:3-dehydroquinate dehydratase/shikimate dehydrogenase